MFGEGGSFGGVVGVVVVEEMKEELVEVKALVKKRKNEGERRRKGLYRIWNL